MDKEIRQVEGCGACVTTTRRTEDGRNITLTETCNGRRCVKDVRIAEGIWDDLSMPLNRMCEADQRDLPSGRV